MCAFREVSDRHHPHAVGAPPRSKLIDVGVAGCRARAGARARGPGDRGRAGRCTRTPVPVVALLSDWANARDASARGATRLLAWEPETGIAEQVKPQEAL